MRVGWISDDPGYVGGAELTQIEFLAAAPDDVEIVKCPPGEVDPDVDHFVANNVVHYSLADFEPLRGKPITWFHHDLSSHINPEVRAWLDTHANHIFCSPSQSDRYGAEGICIPPALDLAAFWAPRQSRKRRKGTCTIAQWRSPGKGAQAIREYAAANGPVDVFGDGPFAPAGPNLSFKGPLAPADVAQTLWSYETFVYLPFEFEPFGRCVAEAHAAGCSLVTNRLIGARHYLENDPGALQTAGETFWEAILA